MVTQSLRLPKTLAVNVIQDIADFAAANEINEFYKTANHLLPLQFVYFEMGFLGSTEKLMLLILQIVCQIKFIFAGKWILVTNNISR